jgi:hypothetical protein
VADEIQVRASLNIRQGSLDYRSSPTAFNDDRAGEGGPTPGGFTVSVGGTDVDLSALSNPGWCWVQNLDDTNTVRMGVWNPDQSEFYPLLRWKPGQGYPVLLDELINQEQAGTGTGTTGQTNTLRMKADNAPCKVIVHAFEE